MQYFVITPGAWVPHVYDIYSGLVTIQSLLLSQIIEERDKSSYITLSGVGIMTLMTIVKTVDSVMSSPDLVDPCNS